MTAYYNEYDPFAAAWLRELIAEGLIAPGDVDERSIEDVIPSDLVGYCQCHFFAGIGIWSFALRQAGYPDNKPIWTGSCPCQPFSAAGKGGGFADERHLWPAFHHLIRICRPDSVLGEQVASKDGLAWLDLVQTDMEGEGYTFGAVDTCAAGFGAPHIRQRLYWVALPDGGHTGAERQQRSWEHGQQPQDGGASERVADAEHAQRRSEREIGAQAHGRDGFGGSGDAHDPAPTNGLWRDVDWLGCRDGKWRPVEPGTFPLADGRTFRNRVAALRGAGNALNLAQAQGFIEAMLETIHQI